MRAVRNAPPGVEVVDVDEPEGDGELVRVSGTGICASDLGYLHVHPEPTLADGAIKFWLAAPGTGSFRMFLNFQVDGVVQTASFTVAVS